MESARTISEAKQARGEIILDLASTSLASVPDELASLRSISVLNLADNDLQELPVSFPPKLSELMVTGNALTALPASLSQLQHLKKLHAGANMLTDIRAVFQCSQLQHVGVAFNNISELPASLPSTCKLLSLDLSNNNITDLNAVLDALACLPALRALSLAGNPVCLMPTYAHAVRDRLKSLLFFDGQRIDALTAAPSQAAVHTTTEQSGVDTFVQVELTGLTPLEDPFKEEREQMELLRNAAMVAAAAAPPSRAATPPNAVDGTTPPEPPPLPLQPTYYHVELSDPAGVSYASVPVRVLPPLPPSDDPAPVAGKGSKKDAKKDAKGAEAPPPPVLKRGQLRACLSAVAAPAWRDWLRSGVRLTLHRTTLKAIAKDVPEEEHAPPPTPPPKGKGKGKDVEPPPPPPFDVVSTTDVVADAMLRCGTLVGGHTHAYEAEASFVPIPALWDDAGLRMGLEDERHPTQPVASVHACVKLHVAPPCVDAGA